MRKIVVFFFVCLYITNLNTGVQAQTSPASIDSLVQYALTKFNVAGVAVGIVKDGKIIYEKGFGVRSINNKLPVDQYTNFQIASNSKAFTTAALSILIDEGKLSWKDKVRKYLPEFKMYNDYVTENFLVEDLLCHRSGLGLGAGDLMDFPDGTDFTIQDKLTFAQHFKPVSDFRTKFDYDNQLYFIAGELIARISGMSWEEFIQTRIMTPLNMSNSAPSLKLLKDKTTLAAAHSTETGPIKVIPHFDEKINGAAGGIVSNVNDICKWMITQINKGAYGSDLGKKLFSEERQREMWTIHTVLPTYNRPRYNSHFTGYGLGWDLSDIKGILRVSHTGGLPGMLTSVTLIPDLKLGVVVLTNTANDGGYLFTALRNTIIDRYLGLEDVGLVDMLSKNMKEDNSGTDSVVKKVWQTVAASKGVKINPADYTGVYEDKWFGKVEVFLKDKQLWFKAYRSPKLNGPMQLYKANAFAIKWEYQDMNCDAFAIFSLDEEGKAQSIKMKGISPAMDFSFDFQDLDLQRINEGAK
jgi:CubicO group peptidase (beta-lactamase class C family)